MNLESIRELKELKKEKEKLVKRETELTTPTLTDFSLIKVIYDYFWKIMEERSCSPRRESTIQRKKFLFIILNLYSPEYFCNKNMAYGLRKAISRLFEYKEKSAISHMCHDIVSQYIIYKDLRNDIDDISQKIVILLENDGYI